VANFLENNRTLIIFEGVLFTLLGAIAVIIPGISTLGIELFLGWLILFSGGVQFYRTVQDRSQEGFWGSLFTSIIYIVFGLLLILYPLSGVVSLTLLLIFFFILEGLAKIYFGFVVRPWSNSIWFILNGVLALAMAAIIWAGWPGTAFWALGLLVGINMIFFGISLIFFGSTMPKGITK